MTLDSGHLTEQPTLRDIDVALDEAGVTDPLRRFLWRLIFRLAPKRRGE